VNLLELPEATGNVLARSVEASWPVITVHGFDVTAFTRGQRGPVTWRTLDGGRSWAIERS
jgi:hypothetical protein